MNRIRHRQGYPTGGVPRVCGDEPGAAGGLVFGGLCSPRVRG